MLLSAKFSALSLQVCTETTTPKAFGEEGFGPAQQVGGERLPNSSEATYQHVSVQLISFCLART